MYAALRLVAVILQTWQMDVGASTSHVSFVSPLRSFLYLMLLAIPEFEMIFLTGKPYYYVQILR